MFYTHITSENAYSKKIQISIEMHAEYLKFLFSLKKNQ